MNKILAITLLISSLLFAACEKASEERWINERNEIRSFLEQAGIDYYEDPEAGYFLYFLQEPDTLKDQPDISSTLELRYKGQIWQGATFYNSFDSSSADMLPLSGTIPGFQLASQKMYVGSQAVFILPSRLAYGEQGLAPDIPGHSILSFELSLEEVHVHF